jgi:UDP-N-acetylmuramate dehydrogenase
LIRRKAELNFELRIRRNVKLSRYTTFRIGGPADFFVRVQSINAFKKALYFARTNNIPFIILGGGSNLLICDQGIRGLAIKNGLKGIRKKGNTIIAKSGEKLSSVIEFAMQNGLSGFEFAYGIPGSLGGAIYGNAGAYGKAVGDLLIRAKLMDREGNVWVADKADLGFKYRHSFLKENGEIVLEAEFQLKPGNPQEIRRKMEEIIEERCRKHPARTAGCAGSYFKNLDPPKPGEHRIPAGAILEKVGAKGMRKGKAVVFSGHANFITNPGGATASEVLELARELKEKVKAEFGIELEEEVLYIDEYLRGYCKEKISHCWKNNDGYPDSPDS